MRESVLALYHRLPGPVQSAAASVHGWRLKRWRYGPETDRLVADAFAREKWSPEQWSAFQRERLTALLRRAADRVPFYRRRWEARRSRGDRSPVDRLESWPILTKDELREDPRAFLADDVDPRRLYLEQTSGTTGKPLRLWRSRQTVRAWFALFEARARRWNGVSRKDRWAMLGGQLVVPVGRRRPPFWVWNAALRQLYLSSYHLCAETVSDYLEAMRRHGVVSLLGYASSMTTLAQASLDSGTSAPRLRVAISNAESLSGLQRDRIASAFSCPVRDTYGMAEIVGGGSECEAGSLHLWPEAGVLEVLEDASDAPARTGQVGRLVFTGLLNGEMPLVRYEIGDRGAPPETEEPCACGRTLPRLSAVEGRSDDVLVTPEGRRIGRLDPVFKADLRIREAQIIQDDLARVRVLLVAAPGYGPEDEHRVRQRLRERLGDAIAVSIEAVDAIPRGPGGKFRAVVSRIGRPELPRASNEAILPAART